MIPSDYDYYERRAHEHRCLANNATLSKQRQIHDRLVEAYTELARRCLLRRPIRIKADL
jgi:hypothetical protein